MPPLITCTRLRQCIQDHLNYHLSSTSLVFNRIDNLDAAERLWNPSNRTALNQVTLREMLYQLKLENRSPLFLQLTQRPSGEVEAVITNMPEAKLKVEKINQQVAAWCINYWIESNPQGMSFYRKLTNQAFNQVLLH
jgi:hypothetical protein